MKFKNTIILLLITVLAFLSIFWLKGFLHSQNNDIEITRITLDSYKVKGVFKAIHISDLHGKDFGNNNKELITKIKNQKPDCIFFTGDLIDSSTKDLSTTLNTMASLCELSKVYYIPGNHEWYRLYKTFDQLTILM